MKAKTIRTKKPASKKSTHYVDKKQLYEEMKKYYERKIASDTPITASNYIGSAILMICDGVSKRFNFVNYTFRDELVDEAVKDCVKALGPFDPNKSDNPFGYFSFIAYNAMVRVILDEQKQSYIKHKNFNRTIMAQDVMDEQNEFSDDVITQFEERLKREKIKKKQKAKEKAANSVSNK